MSEVHKKIQIKKLPRDQFRLSVDFRVFGEELDPEKITKLTGLSCDYSNIKGNPIKSRYARKAISKHGLWALKSDLVVKSINLEDHFSYLFEKLNNLETIFHKLKEDNNEVHFTCTLFYPYTYEGPTISRATLNKIASFNAELGFEYYFTGQLW